MSAKVACEMVLHVHAEDESRADPGMEGHGRDLFPVLEFSFAEEGPQCNGYDAPEMVVGVYKSQR